MILPRCRAAGLLLAAALALSFNCSENPFGGEDKISDRRQVRGQVVFGNGDAAAGVFVWLDRYDLSARTAEDGRFVLALPPLQNQQGVVAEGTLYFYLADYKLATAQVKITEGQFAFDQAGIDAEGRLRGPIVMVRAVDIVTLVTPPAWPANQDSLEITVRLVADEGCVLVYNPLLDVVPRDGVDFAPLGAALLHHTATGQVFTLRTSAAGSGAERLQPCANQPIHRRLMAAGPQLQHLPAGRYEVIPYLWLEPEGTPQALLAHLGAEVNELGESYLKKPMHRQPAIFEIRQQPRPAPAPAVARH